MRLTTRLTIGSQTETFDSSPATLGTNLYVTLLHRKMGLEICKKIEQALLTADYRHFRFQDRDIAIEADEALETPRLHAEQISVAA